MDYRTAKKIKKGTRITVMGKETLDKLGIKSFEETFSISNEKNYYKYLKMCTFTVKDILILSEKEVFFITEEISEKILYRDVQADVKYFLNGKIVLL